MTEQINKNPQNQVVQQRLLQLKLKRIEEVNRKLKESLSRERIYASNASYSVINYVSNEKDYTLPEIWGFLEPGQNPLRANSKARQQTSGGQDNAGCCILM